MPNDPLNRDKILAILDKEGLLSRSLPGFEVRPSQIEMAGSIFDCYEEEKTSLIEAGTGTGKSIAYLLPALFWSLANGKSTVISTGTIALQQQLMDKDIPFLAKALNTEFKAVLVKGMQNYLCLRKLGSLDPETEGFSDEEKSQFSVIQKFARNSIEGSRHELLFKPSPLLWEKVMVEKESCTHQKCPHFKECFFFKARKEAQEAHLIVTNHHLLFADLSLRAIKDDYNNLCLLPAYRRLVIDEAHHVEDIATEYFAQKVSRLGLLRVIGRLLGERGTGKFPALIKKFGEFYPPGKGGKEIEGILSKLLLDLPSFKKDCVTLVDTLFVEIRQFLIKINASLTETGEWHFRFLPRFQNHPAWLEVVIPQALELKEALKSFLTSIFLLKKEIIALNDKNLEKGCEGILIDIEGIAAQIEGLFASLEAFIFGDPAPNTVRIIETSKGNVQLVTADLEIGPRLKEQLFAKMHSTLLCSATLAASKDFTFIRQRLGISDFPKVDEMCFPPPFDFEKQALLAVPTDLPPPNTKEFGHRSFELIWEAISASRGGVFVLFTSYSMLKACEKHLENRLKEADYTLYVQGNESRHLLLDKFKKNGNGILFGTDSFWEGVDVVGDALRCVILAKLPFRVPTEPLLEARYELLTKEGKNPFFDYALPSAMMKFKQGFGRLIRNQSDRGCVLCLDSRLFQKNYGKMFLKVLPPVKVAFEPAQNLPALLQSFYNKPR